MRCIWLLPALVSLVSTEYKAPPIDFSRLTDAMVMIAKYSSIHEMIDSVVDDLIVLHPELYPGDDESTRILKREITYFLTLSDSEKDEIMAGFPSEYKYLSTAMKTFMEIGKRQEPVTDFEQQLKDRNENQYIMFKMCLHLLMNHLESKKMAYAKEGLTKDQIRMEIGNTQLRLIDLYHKGDPNTDIVKASKEAVRNKYEL